MVKQWWLPAVAGALVALNASAQSIEDFVVTGEAARTSRLNAEISAETAGKIVQGCLDYAEANGGRVSIFVVGPGGDIVYVHRMDGQDSINVHSAQWKAETALKLRAPTSAFGDPDVEMQVRYLKMDLFLNQGGLPIVVDDVLIGAVGVGGWYMEDEPCAVAGFEAAGLEIPTMDGFGNETGDDNG